MQLKVGSWKHLEQIPTVMVTIVQATFVRATFVHFRNISIVTDLILIKLYGLFIIYPLPDDVIYERENDYR